MTIQPTETTESLAIEHLDFHPDVECDQPKCDATAAWYVIHRCCGCVYPNCDRHKNRLLAYLIRKPGSECRACDKSEPRGLAKVRFEPIKPA